MPYNCSRSLSVTKANLKNSCALEPDIPVIIKSLLSNHSGYEIYEAHRERGCILEYCHTLSGLKKLMAQETLRKTRSNGNTPGFHNRSGI